MVEARIRGEGSLLFALDPGNETVIARQVATRLGLPASASAATGDTAIHVEGLKRGTIELAFFSADLWDATPLSPGSEVPAGILALELLSDHLVTFDYAKRQLRLETGALPGADGRDILAYTLDDENRITVPTDVAGHGGLALGVNLDAGVIGGLSRPPRTSNDFRSRGSPPAWESRSRTTGSESTSWEAACRGS